MMCLFKYAYNICSMAYVTYHQTNLRHSGEPHVGNPGSFVALVRVPVRQGGGGARPTSIITPCLRKGGACVSGCNSADFLQFLFIHRCRYYVHPVLCRPAIHACGASESSQRIYAKGVRCGNLESLVENSELPLYHTPSPKARDHPQGDVRYLPHQEQHLCVCSLGTLRNADRQ